MQVFRLMDLPDKVIAFDALPKRLTEGFELCPAEGFPRHWKEWMGKTERVIKVPPERDPITQQVRKFEPIYEKDYFFYLVDWRRGPVEEKWREVCEFVKTHVSKDTRLKENIADMALPLAANKTDSVTLEPEDVPIIQIAAEYQELDGVSLEPKSAVSIFVRCEAEGCTAEFDGERARQALRMHAMRKHPAKEKVAAI